MRVLSTGWISMRRPTHGSRAAIVFERSMSIRIVGLSAAGALNSVFRDNFTELRVLEQRVIISCLAPRHYVSTFTTILKSLFTSIEVRPLITLCEDACAWDPVSETS